MGTIRARMQLTRAGKLTSQCLYGHLANQNQSDVSIYCTYRHNGAVPRDRAACTSAPRVAHPKSLAKTGRGATSKLLPKLLQQQFAPQQGELRRARRD
jgi:hypothetical protein